MELIQWPQVSFNETQQVVFDDSTKSTFMRKKKKSTLNHYYYKNGSKSSAMERAEGIQANLSLQFPNFVKLMLPSHVSRGFCLSLPKRFCYEHLPSENAILILVDEKGEEFKTKYLKTKVGLSGGWRGFSIVHKLMDGDVLVFQLVEPTKFKVYIVRASSFDKMDEPNEILCVEPLATHMSNIGTQEKQLVPVPRHIPHARVRNDSHMELYTFESDTENSDYEMLEDSDTVRFSESDVEFKDIISLESFTVRVNSLIIDSEFSKYVLAKYYDLCKSQNSFLHANLLVGLNLSLIVGIINETVNIADAINVSEVRVSQEDISIWYKTLKAFESMGMTVKFVIMKLEKLLDVDPQLKRRCDEASTQRVQAKDEVIKLQEKLLKIRNVTKKFDAVIEALTVTTETPYVIVDDSGHSSYSSNLEVPKLSNFQTLYETLHPCKKAPFKG